MAEPWWKPNVWPAKTRTRRVLRMFWCLAFDWTEPVGALYSSSAPWWRRIPGELAQNVWHDAHNCRFYNWLDEPVRTTFTFKAGPDSTTNGAYSISYPKETP
jgi:hypothetical protein